jgi:4a-hydroxytetrahydrobiopterin dehydratase
MTRQTTEPLALRRCSACEGGLERYTPEQAQAQVALIPGWRLHCNATRLRRDWQVRDFAAGILFFNQVADLAEDEGHHPDVHLEGYRHVWIELWTHAIGGLSENDFILAAKIDQLPVKVKTP